MLERERKDLNAMLAVSPLSSVPPETLSTDELRKELMDLAVGGITPLYTINKENRKLLEKTLKIHRENKRKSMLKVGRALDAALRGKEVQQTFKGANDKGLVVTERYEFIPTPLTHLTFALL